MKIERKYMAHFLNAAFGSGTASYCRLGNDLEEYSPELSANVEKKNNILGQTSIDHRYPADRSGHHHRGQLFQELCQERKEQRKGFCLIYP